MFQYEIGLEFTCKTHGDTGRIIERRYSEYSDGVTQIVYRVLWLTPAGLALDSQAYSQNDLNEMIATALAE